MVSRILSLFVTGPNYAFGKILYALIFSAASVCYEFLQWVHEFWYEFLQLR